MQNHDHMETGSITAVGGGWYWSDEIHKKFRWDEQGRVVDEEGNILVDAPYSQQPLWDDADPAA
jgi:hypothetical protein